MLQIQTTHSLENSYYKTILVIESCRTKEQLEGASRMVENFKNLYGKVGYPRALSYNLDRKLDKTYFRVTEQYS
jgi:hypothetical protein